MKSSDRTLDPRSRYSRTTVAIALLIGAVAATVIALIVSAAASDAAGESSYVPLTPARILDTRPTFQVGSYSSPWPADTARSLTVTGVGGVPAAGVQAVVLNITTVSPTAANSFLSVFPTGESQPTTASLNFVAGEIKNDVVVATVGAGGQIDIYNQLGSVDLVIDVNGYYTNSVEARLAQVETLLAGLSRTTVDGHDTLLLSGANLQIVNGLGSTYSSNSTGNLIIGYNRDSLNARTGSHNIIVGDLHTYTGSGTVVFGFDNEASGPGAAVTGGFRNTASGEDSSVTGGSGNIASGTRSTVSGGNANEASATAASVSGGSANAASAESASVSGGDSNEASATAASVSGGSGNEASGNYSSVAGGRQNTASGSSCSTAIVASSVSGGYNNTASGCLSSILGGGWTSAGFGNRASGELSTIVGGMNGRASGKASSVNGGSSNIASGERSTVGGGASGNASGIFDWRAGTLFEND